jgi:hypothetical protein
MCNCKVEVEEMLAGKLAGSLPTGTQDVRASIAGFALLMGQGQQLVHKNQVQVQFTYTVPGNNGPELKKQKMALTGNFCMFCGERYDRQHAPGAE